MKIIDTISKMSTLSRILKKEGKAIGFVPTMGYLHEGHLSLIRTAKKHTDVLVVSIFVNPTQFAPGEDYNKYPRDFKRDEGLARDAGADIVFYPKDNDMYPEGYATYVNVERLSDLLCGRSRPGHFRGVATVVTKLFEIAKPDIAYFGQKDAQQAIIIKKMVQDLNMSTEIKILPTVREADGLAMSSRNVYLSGKEREEAVCLYQSLIRAEELIDKGERDSKKIIRAIEDIIKTKSTARIDYIAIVDTKELRDIKTIEGEALIALAIYIGKTRLIDNTIVRS